MKNNWSFLVVMLTIILITLAACGSSSDDSNAESNQSPDSSSIQNENGEASNKDLTDTDDYTASEAADESQVDDEEATSDNTYAISEDEEAAESESTNTDSDITEISKEEYLEKLNEMEKADRHAEDKTKISDMEEQEAERYNKWDEELNTIYGVLVEEQLSTEQMNQLRDEQRNWLEHRDEAAKEASLEYEGGSTESLEYVAT